MENCKSGINISSKNKSISISLIIMRLGRIATCRIFTCRIVTCRVVTCRIATFHVPHCNVPHCHVPHCHVPHCHVPHCHVPHCHVPHCHVPHCHVPHCHVPHWRTLIQFSAFNGASASSFFSLLLDVQQGVRIIGVFEILCVFYKEINIFQRVIT